MSMSMSMIMCAVRKVYVIFPQSDAARARLLSNRQRLFMGGVGHVRRVAPVRLLSPLCPRPPAAFRRRVDAAAASAEGGAAASAAHRAGHRSAAAVAEAMAGSLPRALPSQAPAVGGVRLSCRLHDVRPSPPHLRRLPLHGRNARHVVPRASHPAFCAAQGARRTLAHTPALGWTAAVSVPCSLLSSSVRTLALPLVPLARVLAAGLVSRLCAALLAHPRSICDSLRSAAGSARGQLRRLPSYPRRAASSCYRRAARAATELRRRCVSAITENAAGAVRPVARLLLRLSSHQIEHAASSLPNGTGIVERRGCSGHNDGLVDTAGQRGVDVPLSGRRAASQHSLAANAHSTEDLVSMERARSQSARAARPGGAAVSAPERGKWWTLSMHNADHCLGTSLVADDSTKMFIDVFSILRTLPASSPCTSPYA